jgi:photosystem II stability/assembly factor-like uncharacterized protein
MKTLLSTAIIFCGLFIAVNSAFAQTWIPTSTPSKTWVTVASSADGSKLIAGSLGQIYCTSTNSGSTWITNNQPQKGSFFSGSWSSIASSANGTKLVAVLGNIIWVSTNSGTAWFSNNVPGVSFFGSVALSADGTKLVVVVGNNSSSTSSGPIYISTNSGVALMQTTAPTNNWLSVASSADGSRLVAVANIINGTTNGNVIYTSTDSGLNWTRTGAPASNQWISVASSADGSKLVAASAAVIVTTNYYLYGSIYTSRDSGMTWTSNNVPNAQWQSVASSADGTKLVAVAIEPMGLIYTSTNSGTTWISNNVPNDVGWYSVASSADGDKLVAAPIENQSLNLAPIYTLQTIPSPQLNITPSSSNLALSWIIPSSNFALQQNLDLTTTNWVTLTNTPKLNLTNLQDQVILSSSNSNGFFRLIAQ